VLGDNLYIRKNKPMKNLLNNRLFKIICISAIGIFIVTWLAGWLTGSDLGKFPFDANVWGSASDYFSILVTGVSLFFIYRSLGYQRDTVVSQDEKTKRELLDIRSRYKPDIKIRTERSQDGELINLIFFNEGDSMLNVRMTISARPGEVWDDKQKTFFKTNQIFIPKFHEIGRNTATLSVVDNESVNVFVVILFNDRYDLEYRQCVSFSRSSSPEVWIYDLTYVN